MLEVKEWANSCRQKSKLQGLLSYRRYAPHGNRQSVTIKSGSNTTYLLQVVKYSKKIASYRRWWTLHCFRRKISCNEHLGTTQFFYHFHSPACVSFPSSMQSTPSPGGDCNHFALTNPYSLRLSWPWYGVLQLLQATSHIGSSPSLAPSSPHWEISWATFLFRAVCFGFLYNYSSPPPRFSI